MLISPDELDAFVEDAVEKITETLKKAFRTGGKAESCPERVSGPREELSM